MRARYESACDTSNIVYALWQYEWHMKTRIDLRRLECFVALADELHFGRAAERLGMAQPPLTQQIQKLERELGCRVLDRRPRRTVLTEAGRVLAPGARQLLRDAEALVDRTRRAGWGETGRVTLGVPPSVMLTGLPGVIRAFRAERPDVRVSIRELATAAIAEGLAAGHLDVGLLREMTEVDGMPAETVLREPLVAVLPERHPLATRTRLALRQLAAEPFVLFPRRLGPELYDWILACCRDAGFVPVVAQEATQWQSVVAIVETGLGVSLAPASIARLRLSGVVFTPLRGLSTFVSVCAPNAAASPAVAAFLSRLRRDLA